jgi:hypothetical protein
MNFAAVEFVSSIDNVAYSLAASGFLGFKIKSKTHRVEKITFQRDRSWWRSLAIQSVFLLYLSAMVGIWATVRSQQAKGQYLETELCGSLKVEFGNEVFDLSFRMGDDEQFPPLLHYSYFSAEYTAVLEGTGLTPRPRYYERGKVNDATGQTGLFYYCESIRSWVFTIPALESIIPKQEGNCPYGWLMQSPMTEAYKLEDVPASNWNIIVGSGTVEIAEGFSLNCGECGRDSDCSLNGKCNHGSCECFDGWQGRKCNLQAPGTNEWEPLFNCLVCTLTSS